MNSVASVAARHEPPPARSGAVLHLTGAARTERPAAIERPVKVARTAGTMLPSGETSGAATRPAGVALLTWAMPHEPPAATPRQACVIQLVVAAVRRA